MSGPPLTVATWVAAAFPIGLLFAVIVSGRVPARAASALVLGVTCAVAVLRFGADPGVLGVALGKGLWLGAWILGVVWPALLLYGLAKRVGLEHIGRLFAAILPRRSETLLLLAWLFPSFLQGVAGFGTPIAVCAPLLLAAGWGPVRAVVLPLIGYHWSVTFGSMGSSFYMAAFTAGLDGAAQSRLALYASTVLAVQCLVAGALVLWLDGRLQGLREGARMLLWVGVPMAVTLVGVAAAVPAVASLAAGAVGFAAVAVLSVVERRSSPATVGAGDGAGRATPAEEDAPLRSAPVMAPYGFLLLTALPVFLVPSSRAWVSKRLVVAPDFPATETGAGWVNAAVEGYTPFALLGHPGFYVALACLLGYLTYRAMGLWPGGDAGVVREWLMGLPRSSVPILLLAALATVMADSGMVSVLARGAADVAGSAFPLLAPVVGGLGSFMSGSTTTSNALFASLQGDVAGLLSADPAVLLAAQTAGGNVGNALAPVVILVGLSTVEEPGLVGEVLRRCVAPATVLFAVVSVATLARL